MDELPSEVTQLMARHQAPPGLGRRIRFMLEQQDAAASAVPLQTAPARPLGPVQASFGHALLNALRQWWRPLAGFALGALLSLGVLQFLQRSQAREQLAQQFQQQLISSHVRSLMAGHATDVASSDQHTVKPWFVGKLDYAPVVVDLSSAGFSLSGGRLDYLAGRTVAALVYQHGGHVLNLYVQPATPAASDATGATGTSGANSAKGSTPGLGSSSGYNLAAWQLQDMQYWAVTDASADDLRLFQQALDAAVRGNAPSR